MEKELFYFESESGSTRTSVMNREEVMKSTLASKKEWHLKKITSIENCSVEVKISGKISRQ